MPVPACVDTLSPWGKRTSRSRSWPSPREQERVVALRTAALASLAAQGDRRLDVDETTLAGGVIISAFLSKWNPYLKDE